MKYGSIWFTVALVMMVLLTVVPAQASAPTRPPIPPAEQFLRGLPDRIQVLVQQGKAYVGEQELTINITKANGGKMKDWVGFLARNYPDWEVKTAPFVSGGRWVVRVGRLAVFGIAGRMLFVVPRYIFSCPMSVCYGKG
jgi:hypothetical protein